MISSQNSLDSKLFFDFVAQARECALLSTANKVCHTLFDAYRRCTAHCGRYQTLMTGFDVRELTKVYMKFKEDLLATRNTADLISIGLHLMFTLETHLQIAIHQFIRSRPSIATLDTVYAPPRNSKTLQLTKHVLYTLCRAYVFQSNNAFNDVWNSETLVYSPFNSELLSGMRVFMAKFNALFESESKLRDTWQTNNYIHACEMFFFLLQGAWIELCQEQNRRMDDFVWFAKTIESKSVSEQSIIDENTPFTSLSFVYLFQELLHLQLDIDNDSIISELKLSGE